MIGRIILVLMFGLLAWLYFNRADDIQTQSDPETHLPSSSGDNVSESSGPVLRLIKNSPFMMEYGLEKSSAKNDLEAVSLILTESQLYIKNFDTLFLPDNQEITRFLMGGNRDRLAWIPVGHPSVNEQGELEDRWNSPLFFHRQSGTRFQLRSAGPDRKMWNSDDVIFPENPDSQTGE